MPKNKMNIINICAYFVHNPRSGGQKRVFGFNKALSKYASIEQFSFTPVISRKKTYTTKNYTEHIHHKWLFTAGVVALKLFRIMNYDFIIPFVFRFIPIPKHLKKAIKNADIIQLEHPWLFKWIKTKKPIILVEHNVEFDLQKDFYKNNLFKNKITESIKKTESHAVKNADIVFAVSKEDKTRLRELYRKDKIIVVPNGTDRITLSPKKTARKKLGLEDKNIVLFVGAEHPPNKEAVDFIEKKLAHKLRDMLFLVVGGISEKKIKDNIIYTGVIDEKTLFYYYKAADIAINPVISNSGSNFKMVEYLAAGLPVITTNEGARGLELKNNKHAIIGNINNFPDFTNKLINNRELSNKLGKKGVGFIKKHYWSQICLKAISYYQLLSVDKDEKKRSNNTGRVGLE